MFSETDRLKMGLIRENAMANINFWIKERNNKVILWAHNDIQIEASYIEDLHFDNVDWKNFVFYLEGIFDIQITMIFF